MIAYDLQCSGGHIFEGWFEDSHVFEEQLKDALVACPVCGSNDVLKIPSAFAIKSAQPPSETPPSREAVEKLGRRLAEFVDKNFEDVGCDFAREALKIHYGAGEPRNIRGISTADEEKTLREEGVEFFKFPTGSSSGVDS